MRDLPHAIPDADALLALEPEELTAKLLLLVRHRRDLQERFHPDGLIDELWATAPGDPGYPRERRGEIDLALAEAYAWMAAQGLTIAEPGANGTLGWRCLGRRARRFESEADLRAFALARRLPREALHPRTGGTVWMAFMRGEYDVAVFQAMKAVEVAVRDAAGLPAGLVGIKLMRAAFDPERGPLADMQAEPGEREARSAFFAGAIGCYKNPHSHRDVHLDDPAEPVEVVMLANHLLRIVDGAKAAKM